MNSRDIAFPPETKDQLREIHRDHIVEVFRWFGPYVRDGEMKALPIDTYVPIISGPIQDYTRYWLAGQVKESPAKVKSVFADAAWNAVRGADRASTLGGFFANRHVHVRALVASA